MNSLESLGFRPFFSAQYDLLERPDLMPARIGSEARGLWSLHGCRSPLGELSGRLRHELAALERPVVGDWVAVDDSREPAVLHHVFDRSSAMVRRAAGTTGGGQIIAANVDIFFIVTAATRDFNERRIERYVTAVWDSGARPVVLLNKVDLCPQDAEIAAAIELIAPAVPVVRVSATTGVGIDELRGHLSPETTVAFVGSSGVGKSSLANLLLGGDLQDTNAVRRDGKGRHTTTRKELMPIPAGGVVIDTPGMRELGLYEDGGSIDSVFRDVADFATQCRFHDCTHDGTPGCAVEAAVSAGDLGPARLDSYRKIERELAAAARRNDPAAASNTKRRWKTIHKAMRARAKIDPRWRS